MLPLASSAVTARMKLLPAVTLVGLAVTTKWLTVCVMAPVAS